MDELEEYAIELNGCPEQNVPSTPMARSLSIALGPRGQAINQHPESYRRDFPDHILVTDAEIWTRQNRVWYGDIDLTNKEFILTRLAQDYRTSLFIVQKSSEIAPTEQAQAVAKPNLDTLELRKCTGQYRRGQLTRKDESGIKVRQ